METKKKNIYVYWKRFICIAKIIKRTPWLLRITDFDMQSVYHFNFPEIFTIPFQIQILWVNDEFNKYLRVNVLKEWILRQQNEEFECLIRQPLAPKQEVTRDVKPLTQITMFQAMMHTKKYLSWICDPMWRNSSRRVERYKGNNKITSFYIQSDANIFWKRM